MPSLNATYERRGRGGWARGLWARGGWTAQAPLVHALGKSLFLSVHLSSVSEASGRVLGFLYYRWVSSRSFSSYFPFPQQSRSPGFLCRCFWKFSWPSLFELSALPNLGDYDVGLDYGGNKQMSLLEASKIAFGAVGTRFENELVALRD